MIDRGELLAVLRCRLLLLQLRGHGRNALLARRGDFRRQRPASDASRPVVADAVDVVTLMVVLLMMTVFVTVRLYTLDIVDVHIVDGTVVVETISVPVPALIADADVAESIVNAAVVADMRPQKP